jgi:GNAT superfamily N-acetyltransferase
MVRAMDAADVAAALRLSRASGWNQTEADWRFLLAENRERFVAAVRDGRVVGTGGAAVYGDRLAWVCMILVDEAERGHGIGSSIVAAVLDRLAGLEAVGLDATPAGRGVYERLGFATVARLARFGGPASAIARPDAADGTRTLEPSDLREAAALDRDACGADRSRALRWAFERSPRLAWCAIDGGRVAGFCLGRDGDRAVHVGPVVARGLEAARALVTRAAAAARGKELMLDLFTSDPAWPEAAYALGLREQRPFARMYRAATRPAARTERAFAAFGPELG